MKNTQLLRAIGGIDEELIDRAAPKAHPRHKIFAPRLRWIAPIAACLVIATAIGLPKILNNETPSVENPPPAITIDAGDDSEACYTMPDEWRGLPTENYVLSGQVSGDTIADRIVFPTLADFVKYTDVWVVVPNVHETARDGDNMQTAIAAYAEIIGGSITTRQWDDHTVSTGSRVLIRQELMGGCTMDEPNNLLRTGGVYLLPLSFNPTLGSYYIVGDLDALFELNDEGKIVTHSKWEGLNQYDGKAFSELIDAVHALYPTTDAEV
ncbi:MAG: hypothetical protein LBN02_04345 [Oscillospiraceae bacterium]|jgi:hypothetical protein|nr:hypothetical protein [Oscillospiraceae bacterium]